MKNMLRNESDWVAFNQEWGKRYQDAKHILAYINSYPKVLSTLKIGEIHNPYSLDDAQIEWIWLCSKFDNILEIDFFKPYWIPLEANSYDYFMDISHENYPVFDINFFFFEPFKWYKKFVATDIRDILLSPDTGLDLKKILDKNDKIRWKQVDEFFKERKRLGYQGRIYVEPVKYKEIVLNDSVLNPLLTRIGKSEIKFSEVTAIIVGLLPFELKINLKYLKYKDGEQYEALGKVKIIRDLVFFLRDGGMRSVDSYRIDFSDSENCFFNYCAGCCILHHIDNIVLDLFVEAAEFLIINKG